MCQAITRRKEDLRRQLPQEPDADHPDAVKILLKLPNGIRLERRFFKNDSLQVTHSVLQFVRTILSTKRALFKTSAKTWC